MPFHTAYVTNILVALRRRILYILPNLLFHLGISTSGGSIRLSFFGNLNYYYHEYHGIGNSFHDHDHVLVHVHVFRTIPYSLQEIIQIQLDETND